MPADVCLARFEAYLGSFDRPSVPKSLKGEPFWDQKAVKGGPKMRLSGCALGPAEVPKDMFLAHFVAVLDCLGARCVSLKRSDGPKVHRNLPRGQRMWRKDQQGTG